ncbi:hypothetical protein PM082_024002 [Marasmius tenuissimus]|nr:hypothetical protein PM082_024002 [Marasmius tenuissimus]
MLPNPQTPVSATPSSLTASVSSPAPSTTRSALPSTPISAASTSGSLEEGPPAVCRRRHSLRGPAICISNDYVQRVLAELSLENLFSGMGGDIHVALDGNLHHRHLKSGGDGVPFHNSTQNLLKEFVDSVGDRITAARAHPPKKHTPPVPDNVIDSDQDAYKAASGDNQKRSNEAFDENGIMALVCRHDILLFVAMIDTPAEQQKHAVALLLALFQMLPALATVVTLYDIGCVLDWSIHIYDLLDSEIVERLQLATAVMHAYGHQWVCQLHYNPRMHIGLGITDGEGTERLWSRLRKMIGLERRASRAKRIWLLDCQCDSIALDLREGLGKWITRRQRKNVQKKESEAVRVLQKLQMYFGGTGVSRRQCRAPLMLVSVPGYLTTL